MCCRLFSQLGGANELVNVSVQFDSLDLVTDRKVALNLGTVGKNLRSQSPADADDCTAERPSQQYPLAHQGIVSDARVAGSVFQAHIAHFSFLVWRRGFSVGSLCLGGPWCCFSITLDTEDPLTATG
jgi:hypothetical protein